LEGILKGAEVFFSDKAPNVMMESLCEPTGQCNIDQRSFKAYLSRWMAGTVALAPFTYELIMPKLRASAQAAALQCNGPGNACGLRWTEGAQFDGSTGVGEQMSALEIFQANLVHTASGLVTNTTGGTSKGDDQAGPGPEEGPLGQEEVEITIADRVGAGILTAIVVLVTAGSAWWMIT
jgi:mannan endo-1,6-alpha-mannosidase